MSFESRMRRVVYVRCKNSFLLFNPPIRAPKEVLVNMLNNALAIAMPIAVASVRER